MHDLVVASQGGEATELLWGPAVQLALSGHPVYIVPSGWQGDVIPRRAREPPCVTSQREAAWIGFIFLLTRPDNIHVRSRLDLPPEHRVQPERLEIEVRGLE